MNTRHQLLALALLLSHGAANALSVTAVQTSPGPFTTVPGVCTVTFDTTASLGACANTTYSAGTTGQIVSGDAPGSYYAPPNDATPFLTVPGDITITIAGAGDTYFGFYAGTIDSYNEITFSDGVNTLALTGNQINNYLVPGANANGSANGYFNVFTDTPFTSITLSSSQAAFETDNHAFGVASPVPEPASLSLFGLGALALVARRRRAAR